MVMKVNGLIFILVSIVTTVSLAQGYDSYKSKWFTDISEASLYPDRVFQLDLSKQNLKEVPAEIAYFKNIEALKLSDNKIKTLDGVLRNLKNLEFVELSGNKLTHFDFNELYGSRHEITEIYMRDNYLSEIDTSINILSNLSILNLGNNRIKQIEPSVQIPELRYLYLDINRLTCIPDLIQSSTALRVLNLNNNQIEKLILNYPLHTFESINVGDNPCDSLVIGEGFDRVETMILDWLDISPDIQFPSRVKTLSLEHCNLNAVPESIYSLRKLKELSLLYNNLSALEISSDWKKMEKLWVGGNPLPPENLEKLISSDIDVKLGLNTNN